MGTLTPATDLGPLLLGALFQIIGLAVGATLRELVHAWAGDDPRRRRLWTLELIIVVVFAAILGVLFAIATDVNLVGPPFGAALTTYTALSAVHAYFGAREAALPRRWAWAAAHAVACTLVGTIGFTAAVLITGIGSR